MARQLGSKNVAELERVATALYVARERPLGTTEEYVARMRQLKPHINHAEAGAALDFVRDFQVPATAT